MGTCYDRRWGTRIDGGEAYSPVIDYNLEYTSVRSQNHRLVEQFSLAELAGKYINILWDDGSHKYNVKSFLGEIDEILKGVRFSGFDQEMLDSVIGSLRERGNSNATINRKMAALSKLLRKAHKMGTSIICRSLSDRKNVRDGFDSSNMRKKSACLQQLKHVARTVIASVFSLSIQVAA